jgi:hypothetical protein
VSDLTGVEIGMRVKGTGVPDPSYITDITGTDSFEIDNNATATTSTLSLKIGYTAEQMAQRWVDLIIDERFTRLIFGDANGYLYTYAIDFGDDNSYDIDSSFITKDFELNKAGYDFRLLECTLAMQLKDDYEPATVDIRASVDFGLHWTSWITLPLDGTESYMEKKINLNMMGKQVRFEIRMSNPMIFESMWIGFNADYKSMKFDR